MGGVGGEAECFSELINRSCERVNWKKFADNSKESDQNALL